MRAAVSRIKYTPGECGRAFKSIHLVYIVISHADTVCDRGAFVGFYRVSIPGGKTDIPRFAFSSPRGAVPQPPLFSVCSRSAETFWDRRAGADDRQRVPDAADVRAGLPRRLGADGPAVPAAGGGDSDGAV